MSRADRAARRRGRLEDALHQLREAETLDEVLGGLCVQAARATALDWVLASRVRDGVWSPWMLHDDTADRGARDRGQDIVVDLAQLPVESVVVAQARAVTVRDPRAGGHLPQPVRRRRGDAAFVIVPIVIGTSVPGLLHGGRAGGSAEVDDGDRERLSRFALGAGRIIERADLRRRLQAQEALVASIASDAARATATGGRRIELQRLAGQAARIAADDAQTVDALRLSRDGPLTPREREVLALVVQGHGNAAIAELLAIGRGTVKSHVRAVMRKLGVAGRTELIAAVHRQPAIR